MLRRAQAGDAEAIAEVFIAAREEMLAYLPDLHTEDSIRRWIAHVVLVEHEVWIAENGSGTVGFAALHGDLLGHLYVHPDVQRNGVGTELLLRAKKERPDGLRLYVFQQNEGARRFYERHGFRVLELGDGSGNEEGAPDALYGWDGSAR